jgi:tRNA nucleotidyltransferase/poly(A) polymerase
MVIRKEPTVTMRTFLVGGAVRDKLLGRRTKDLDFCVEIPEMIGESVEVGFEAMREAIERDGFTVFTESPEHVTLRAKFPRGHVNENMVGDFVLCREDGPSSDGRHPDWVRVADLAADLDRRDFTVNSLAIETGTDAVIDRHNGLADLAAGILRFVGDPADRIREDALRVMRAVRFSVTKGFTFAPETSEALRDPEVPALLAAISEERREAELRTMFANADTPFVLDVLSRLPVDLRDAMFAGRVRLTSTLKK